MKHYIIVKFNEQGRCWRDWLGGIGAIFDKARAIPGVNDIKLIPGITERMNRFDLMIVIDMTKEALPIYDASDPHTVWKECYGQYIEKKTIFDCD